MSDPVESVVTIRVAASDGSGIHTVQALRCQDVKFVAAPYPEEDPYLDLLETRMRPPITVMDVTLTFRAFRDDDGVIYRVDKSAAEVPGE